MGFPTLVRALDGFLFVSPIGQFMVGISCIYVGTRLSFVGAVFLCAAIGVIRLEPGPNWPK
jgi:hypothetical protein